MQFEEIGRLGRLGHRRRRREMVAENRADIPMFTVISEHLLGSS